MIVIDLIWWAVWEITKAIGWVGWMIIVVILNIIVGIINLTFSVIFSLMGLDKKSGTLKGVKTTAKGKRK